MDYIIEAIVIAASSTGVFGAIIAALLSKAFRKAKEDADKALEILAAKLPEIERSLLGTDKR